MKKIIGTHAVVLGSSMGGLLAARVLSERFERVTIVERDRLPPVGQGRKGVPQGRHAHGFLAGGLRAAERLFPGLREELVAKGGQDSDIGEGSWILGGRPLRLPQMGVRSISCSRPLLEGVVRERVLALPTVSALTGCDVLGVVHEHGKVTGVTILRRSDGSAEEQVLADLFVDATGRGSRLPAWLSELDYPAPREETIRVGIGYATALYRRDPDRRQPRATVIAATPPNRRCGVALATDADHWIVTLVGYFGDYPDPTREGFLGFSATLPHPALHGLIRASEQVSEAVTARFPHSQRRRYDSLARHPERIIATADALCSFNPIFGQGMAVAALEAEKLGECLDDGLGRLWQRFYRATRPIIDVPWSMAAGNDLRFEQTEGQRSIAGRVLRRYLDRLVSVAAVDERVGETFLRVTNLLDPPSALFGPRTLYRVVGSPARSAVRPPVATATGSAQA